MKSFNCCIRSYYAIKSVRDKMINVESPNKHSLDELWDVSATFEATKCRPFPDSTSHKLKWPSANFMTGCSNTDDARNPPTAVGTLQCASHHIHISSTIKTIVNTPISHSSSNVFLNGHITK
mmetsp:Transcript_17815/g.38887  ORF Transcript_17815/g.38887 Transcript_17815/m.38887 type:complete len:122 (+) Transcript_17815:347-712(+)